MIITICLAIYFLGGTIACAALTYRFVEMPFIRLRHSWSNEKVSSNGRRDGFEPRWDIAAAAGISVILIVEAVFFLVGA